ncbi:hypothetical protein B0I37DRAFT_403183 [Chaetomium sp. MPI-CAGE-AT-0009]|nr:hypothetical protein B0I37DRAFT_403183 [Chaetomium sp. MPI-CAGE-AT-0009]
MLTVSEASGLIAAGGIIVQHLFPAALVIILINVVGTENSAATWSTINQTISQTIWPFLLRADSVGVTQRSLPTVALTWAMTLGALLLVVTGIATPLGLYETILPDAVQRVEFAYVRDPTLWGNVTMARPDLKFSRRCEGRLSVNCPGQYQGVYAKETAPGRWESVQTDENSTINTTVPENYTVMFTSATGPGNTLSGLFDIQYRQWVVEHSNYVDKGEPYVDGTSRLIESLIPQSDVLLREGLVVDMRDNPGIGFRNHSVPEDLAHGGTWSEDLTWLEAVTECVDTNLTIEVRIDRSLETMKSNRTYFIADRGAFQGLKLTDLEAPPWNDNQTLDLFGRAHKAARMYNFILGTTLNISLPLDASTKTVPKVFIDEDQPGANGNYFALPDQDSTTMAALEPLFKPSSFLNSTIIVPRPKGLAPTYPDGSRRLFASNFTAITDICRGYFILNKSSLDWRAGNISNPAVECGLVLGAWTQKPTNLPEYTFAAAETRQQNIHVCATGLRASIKTVDFRYNGTGRRLSNLEVDRISDKKYPDDASKPLWAVEHSYDQAMYFDLLWGLVNDSYETVDGFYTTRSEKLWLPANQFVGANAFNPDGVGLGSLAAHTVPFIKMRNTYRGWGDMDQMMDFYGGTSLYPMTQRFRQLSQRPGGASRIPNLIIVDKLAATLIAPAILTLLTFTIALFWATGILALRSPRATLRALRHTYNQTSTGRLATGLLLGPGRSDPRQPSRKWVKGEGGLVVSFGRVREPEREWFCTTRCISYKYMYLPQ